MAKLKTFIITDTDLGKVLLNISVDFIAWQAVSVIKLHSETVRQHGYEYLYCIQSLYYMGFLCMFHNGNRHLGDKPFG